MRQTILDIDGPLNAVAAGRSRPSSGAAPVVFVHGLDGSLANFVDVIPPLAQHRRVAAIDLPGFGYTRRAGRSTRMPALGELTLRALPWLVGEPAILVGNSMGAAVALLAAAADARDGKDRLVAGVALAAPALPRAGTSALDPALGATWLSTLAPGAARAEARRRSSLTPAGRVDQLLRLCVADGATVSEEALGAMVEVATFRRGDTEAMRAWVTAMRSLLLMLTRRAAFHALADAVDVPVLVIDGALDPIIPVRSVNAMLERHPTWSRRTLTGVGHAPQLEAPARFTEALTSWAFDHVDPKAPGDAYAGIA